MASPVTRQNVAPVQTHRSPDRQEPPRGWVIAVLTALAGLAGGYLIGAGTVPSPVIPDVEDLPAPAIVVPEEALIQAQPEIEAPARSDGTGPGPPLDERIPGFHYRLLMTGVDQRGAAGTWAWHPDLASATATPVALAGTPRLDRSGRWLAYTDGDGTLFAGAGTGPSRVMDGVPSFAWSVDEEGVLAWVEQRLPDRPATLHTGTVLADGVYFRPLGELADFEYSFNRGVWEGPEVVHFDQQGLVLQSSGPAVRPRVYSLDANGALLGYSDGIFLGASALGEVAMLRDYDGTMQLVDRSLEGGHGIGVAPVGPVSWSHTGAAIAFVESAGRWSAQLTVWSPDGARRSFPLGTYWAEVEAWSPDDRFVALTGSRRIGRQVLMIVDITSGDVVHLQPGFSVQQVVISSLGDVLSTGTVVVN